MKLLLTATAYPPSVGGAQLLHHYLAKHLSDVHEVQVSSLWDTVRSDWLLGTTLLANNKENRYDIDGVSVNQIGLSKLDKIRLAPLALLFYPMMQSVTPKMANIYLPHLLQEDRKLDIVHNVRIGRVPFSYASRQLALKHNAPFVLTPVHHPRWTGWQYRSWLELYRAADAVIALTENEKKILHMLGVDEKRIHVTGMGPILAKSSNPQQFCKRYGLKAGPIVLFLGQHRPYKGYRQLLKSAPIVWSKHPDTQFVFMGPSIEGSEAYFQDCDSRIFRTGPVDLQTKTDALDACTMLCLPSSQESFGGVYVEAWYFKKPVIGCPIPAVSGLIDDGISGYVTPQNPNTIAECISHLLDSPKLADSMGLNGYQKVQDNYTWDKLGEMTENIYRSVLTGY